MPYQYAYAAPTTWTDPSGQFGIQVNPGDVNECFAGIAHAIGYANSLNMADNLAPKPWESQTKKNCRSIGNLLASIQGVSEVIGGGSLMGGGGAACVLTVGGACVVSVPAAAGGAALASHGATVATCAAANQWIGIIRSLLASSNRGGGGGGGSPPKPDPAPAPRKPWTMTAQNTDRTLVHGKFGKFFRHKSTEQWWSKDQAGHGGSVWKVFEEESKGLKWIEDADKYGKYLRGKHKGSTGLFIPWKELH